MIPFGGTNKIIIISPLPYLFKSSRLVHIRSYLPVIPSLWQIPFQKDYHKFVYIANYQPIGDDSYQCDLLQLIQKGLVKAFGAHWDKINVPTQQLTHHETNQMLGHSFSCYSLMHPSQRGRHISSRMWKAPINGCFVFSEVGTNIYDCPGVVEVDGFTLETIEKEYPLAACRLLSHESILFWERSTKELSMNLGLSSQFSVPPKQIRAMKRKLYYQHLCAVLIRIIKNFVL